MTLGRLSLSARFAASDHLVGLDLRMDHADRYTLLVGIPFLSFKLTVRRG